MIIKKIQFSLYKIFDTITPKTIKKSIIYKTLYVICLSSLIVMIIASFIKYLDKYNDMISQLHNDSAVILNRISNSITIPIWEFNSTQIETVIDLEMTNNNVLAIELIQTKGLNIGKLRVDGTIKQIYPAEHYKELYNPFLQKSTKIFYQNDNLIGVINIYFTDNFIRKELVYSFFKDLLLILVMMITIILFDFLSLKRTVLDPVVYLEESVKNLANKEFDTRIDIHNIDEIGSLAKSFNEMAETIEDYNMNMQYLVEKRTNQLIQAEKMASLGEMVAGVAHEINTPVGTALTAITHGMKRLIDIDGAFQSNTLSKSDLSRFIDEIKESFNITTINLQRAAELITSFKKVASDRKNEERRIFKLKDYINTILLSLKPKYQNKNYTIKVICDDNLELNGYPGLFSQIITNFVINSLIHGLEDRNEGNIIIEAFIEGKTFVLKFFDDGKGISPDYISKIFEPFFTTKRNQGGTGLGLNIVYNIVNYNFFGTVVCESKPGEGALFIVKYPITE